MQMLAYLLDCHHVRLFALLFSLLLAFSLFTIASFCFDLTLSGKLAAVEAVVEVVVVNGVSASISPHFLLLSLSMLLVVWW